MTSIVMTSIVGVGRHRSKVSRAGDREGIGVVLLFSLFFFVVNTGFSWSLKGNFVVLSCDAIIDPSAGIGDLVGLVAVDVTLTSGGNSHTLGRVNSDPKVYLFWYLYL